MPLHADFQRILESFKEEYGEEEGERRFYAWLRSRGYDETKSMAWNLRREAVLDFTYVASVTPTSMSGGIGRAEVYVIDTTMNGNCWMVTEEALRKALETLKDAPLIGPPTLGHRSNHAVGYFRDFRLDPGGAVYGIAEITDPEAWEAVKAGRWRYVSPRIIAYRVDHSPTGAEIVRDFRFDHVAFVENPAYPRAGVHSLLAGYCGFSQALEAALSPYLPVFQSLNISRSPLTGDNQASSEAKMKEKTDKDHEGFLFEAGAVPSHETAKADKERNWDSGEAATRLRRWAGGPEKDRVDWAKYMKGFAWVDPESSDDYAGYKLPHHDIIDGELVVVWRGVAAAMAALLGARGGVDIPAGDRRAVYDHLARHYRQFEEEPPEYHAEVDKMEKEKEEGKAAAGEAPRSEYPQPQLQELPALRVEVEKLKAENRELRELVARLEEERLEAELIAFNDQRKEVGLDPFGREEWFKLSSDAREALRRDIGKLSTWITGLSSTRPKARFTAPTNMDMIEGVRERLFGYKRGGKAE
ncbi:MAG: hypothetical protein QXE79_04695 [Candidatus Bathyarchaeia archaeon]